MKQMKVQVLKADPEKYPGLTKNPALERALRIQQAMEAGKPREEAIAMAEQAMGKRAPKMSSTRPEAKVRPVRKSGAPKRAAHKATKAKARR